jgi:hypothetical protein
MRPFEAVSALAIGRSVPARIAAAQAGVNLPRSIWIISAWLKDYSVLLNVIDVVVILCLCFASRTSRERILATFERARID